MAKGENIFKRKDGRWEARYIKSRDITGKIQYGFCYGKTYREAKEKVTKKKQRFRGWTLRHRGMTSLTIAINGCFLSNMILRNLLLQNISQS